MSRLHDSTANRHVYINWESGLQERSTFCIKIFLRFLVLVLFSSDFNHLEKWNSTGYSPTSLHQYLHWLWIVSSITELFLKVHSSLSCIILGYDNSSAQFLTSVVNKTDLWFLVITETQLKGSCSCKTWAEEILYIFVSILRTCVTITIIS